MSEMKVLRSEWKLARPESIFPMEQLLNAAAILRDTLVLDSGLKSFPPSCGDFALHTTMVFASRTSGTTNFRTLLVFTLFGMMWSSFLSGDSSESSSSTTSDNLNPV